MKHRGAILGAFLVALAVSHPLAQQRGARDVARWLQNNRHALREYRWKVRTEILIDGESIGVRVDDVRLGEDGRPRRTPVQESGADDEDGSRPRKRSKKRMARAREQEQALRRLTDTYQHMDFDTLRDAFSRAFVDELHGGGAGVIRVQVRDVVHRGDSMNLWLDDQRLPTRLEVFSALDGEPVRMTAEYESLEDGPSVAVRSVVETESGEKKLVVRSESFDFVKDAAS